jgi:hypothetical protein
LSAWLRKIWLEIKLFSTFFQRVVTHSQLKNRKIPTRRSTAGRTVTAGIRVSGLRRARRNPLGHSTLPSPEPDVGSRIVGRPRATKACIERVLSSWTIPTARIAEAVDMFLPLGLNKVDD